MDSWSKPITLQGNTKFDRTFSLIDTQLHSDFTIKADSLTGDVTIYHVHKCILAIASPVWERNILWVHGSTSMKINGFPLDVISCLLIYAYTNLVQFHSLEFCLEVAMAADYFCIANISDHCVNYIKTIFSSTDTEIEDLILVFNVGSLLGVFKLIELCIAYIENNPDYVLTSREFNNLTLESIRYLIHLDNYLVPESKLIFSVLNWSILQTTAENLRNFLSENKITNGLQFRLLSIDDLQDIFQIYPTLFTNQEQIAMMNRRRENMMFSIDFMRSEQRGHHNIINNDEILVQSPPVVIVEKFIYINDDSFIPIISLEIEPRNNSYVSSFSRRYEESISIKIEGYQIDYDEVLKYPHGPTLSIPFDISVVPRRMLKIEITLKKPGVYKKNDNFKVPVKGMMRSDKGLIRSFNNFEKYQDTLQQIEPGGSDFSDIS